ncbi:cytochrome c oxidase subunit 3 [Novosphingobium sp. BL-52-GroH]|uniref:cytochrome c oxidase subunit 3 n=1 Tax=Novosphingobium sp. BL-52-GroH TaxID=3349877 RepID=UPI00384D4483
MHGQSVTGKAPERDDTLPGDEGVFFFITADMAMFAVFFLLFMVGQAQDPEGYRASRAALDPMLGLGNTLILVFSGWWMVRAVEAGRAEDWVLARSRVLAAMLFGSAFAITKAYEYYAKISKGITLTTSEFFGYYFAFTGIHFLHFALGIGVLAITAGKLARPEGAKTRIWLESAAAYWHMVDLLWMVLFPMLYLAGGTA